jgi:hypothetical protein
MPVVDVILTGLDHMPRLLNELHEGFLAKFFVYLMQRGFDVDPLAVDIHKGQGL